jgi:hypothetical protein
LIKLLRARDGTAAEAHWRKHVDGARGVMTEGLESVKARAQAG